MMHLETDASDNNSAEAQQTQSRHGINNVYKKKILQPRESFCQH